MFSECGQQHRWAWPRIENNNSFHNRTSTAASQVSQIQNCTLQQQLFKIKELRRDINKAYIDGY